MRENGGIRTRRIASGRLRRLMLSLVLYTRCLLSARFLFFFAVDMSRPKHVVQKVRGGSFAIFVGLYLLDGDQVPGIL